MQLPLPFASHEEARQLVLQYRDTDNGVVCPTCDLVVKIYPRTCTSSMARVAIRMARHHDEHGDKHMNVTESLHRNPLGKAGGGGDWAKLKYWNLIEAHPEEDLWRITEKGLAFARGLTSIPKRLKVFNDQVLDILDATPVTIRHCLGKRFRLEELYEGLGRPQQDLEYGGASGLAGDYGWDEEL